MTDNRQHIAAVQAALLDEPTYEDTDNDRTTRWRPDVFAMVQAKALLAAEPDAKYVLVPMIQPGKIHGIWTYGQEVLTVPGVLILSTGTDEPRAGVMSHSHARNLVWTISGQVLADTWARRTAVDRSNLRPGTTAYAVISRDDPHGVPVFED